MKNIRSSNLTLAVLITLCVLLLVPQTAYAKKVALIIGISDYQTMRDQNDTSSNAPVGDLRGAAYDAQLVRQVIMDRYDFRTENIKLLVDQQATKANITDAMSNWILKKVEKGDTAILYISGHGTQILSRGADPNEIWDQAFLCYDYSPVSTAANAPAAKRNIVIDNDFGNLFDKLSEKTDDIIMIADCCYSGSMSRDALPGLYSAKWLPASDADRAMAKDAADAPAVLSGMDDNVTFIGACADTEQASEAEMPDGKWHGAMSYYLIKTLQEADRNMNYNDMINRMRVQVQAKFRQTPQLKTKNPEWPIFGGSVSNAAAVIPEQPVIQQPATNPTNNVTTTDIQQPAVTTVTTTTTTIAETKNDILYVKITSNGKSDLRSFTKRIDNIANIDIAQTNGKADRIIAVTSEDGKLKAKLVMRDGVADAEFESDSAEKLSIAMRPFLQKAWLIKIISSLQSADPSMEPQITINAQHPKNLNIKPISIANPGLPVVYTGSTVSFSVKPSKECYLTLVDIASDGSISVLLPNSINTGDMKLLPGRTYNVPTPEMNFEIVVEPPTGTEMVVAIATQQPLQLNNLAVKTDESRGGIGVIRNAVDGGRLFMVKPKSDVMVTTTTTTATSPVGLLPSEGFGISFTMAEVKMGQ